jgi:hypothetical protein
MASPLLLLPAGSPTGPLVKPPSEKAGIIWLRDFEGGTVLAEDFTTVGGNLSYSTAQSRMGTRSVLIAQVGSSPGTKRKFGTKLGEMVVGRVWVRLDTVPPAATQFVVSINTEGGSSGAIKYVLSTGLWQAVIAGGTAQNGPAAIANKWTAIDFRFDGSAARGAALHFDWSIDGVAQTTATGGKSDQIANELQLTGGGANTLNIWYDDIQLSTDWSAYPLTDGLPSVAVDSTVTPAVNGVSWTHTVGTQTNPYLVVRLSKAATTVASAVTYNGVAMTQLASQTAGTNSVELWGLANPSRGANTVSVTIAGPPTMANSSTSFYNVDQTAVVMSGSGATGTGVTITSAAITGIKGDMLCDATVAGGGYVVSGAGHVQLQNDAGGDATGYLQADGTSQTATWGSGSGTWGSAIACIRSVANPATNVNQTVNAPAATASASAPTPGLDAGIPAPAATASASAPTPALQLSLKHN